MTSPETNQEDTKKAKMMQKRLGNQYLEKESCRQVTHTQSQHALGEAGSWGRQGDYKLVQDYSLRGQGAIKNINWETHLLLKLTHIKWQQKI